MAEHAVEDRWIDNVPAPVALLDPRGHIGAVNEPFKACFACGLEPASGGVGLPFIELVQGGDPSVVSAGMRAVLARRAARFAVDFRESQARGRHLYHLEIVPLAEERAAAFLWQLDARVNLTPSAPQATSLGAPGVGKSVHDLKNMLGVIMGSAEEVLTQLDPDSPLRVDTEEIKRAATRAVDLVADILLSTRQGGSPVAQAGAATRPERGVERILLVEDDYRVRLSSVRSLRNMGYQVIAAESAQQALELAAEQATAVDLLLTDVLLAGMSGAELATQLRAHYPGLRMLLMSGYSVESVRKQLPQGFHGYLEKPFSTQQLSFAVRRALDAGQT